MEHDWTGIRVLNGVREYQFEVSGNPAFIEIGSVWNGNALKN